MYNAQGSSDDLLMDAHCNLEMSRASFNQEYLSGLVNRLVTALEGLSRNLNEEMVPDELAKALTNSRQLLDLLCQQTAELDAIKRLSLSLTSSLDLPTVLDAVIAESMRVLKDARTAHIFLYDQGQLKFGAALFANGKREKPWIEPRPGGFTATVAMQGTPIVVPDMRDHPLYENVPKDWTGSIVGLPLKIGNRVVGVMNVSRAVTGEFSETELRMLSLLADHAAIAIENARLHELVSKQAHSDILTGLPNRRALDERLEEEVKHAQRTGRIFAVVMMDLDGFKAINDTYGHEVGDQILRQTFGTLAHSVRSTDFLARYGGDELTLILPGTDLDTAILVTAKLQEKLRSLNIQLPDGTCAALDLSGGVSVFPTHARTASDLLRAADVALYSAKKSSRGTFVKASGPTGEFK